MAHEKIQGFVLNNLKHNDRHNIVTLFTRTRGRITFLSPNGKGRSAKMRNARLMPMSLIESDVNFRENQDLHFLGAVTPIEIWHEVYFNPVKSAIVYFISDFLNRYFRDSQPDETAWKFILASIRILDESTEGMANFHIWFLIKFLNIAGITPDFSNYQQGDVFDMRAGLPVLPTQLHSDIIGIDQTAKIPILLRISSKNYHKFKFTSSQRREILNNILKYYSIHFPGVGNLKSFEILMEIFTSK